MPIGRPSGILSPKSPAEGQGPHSAAACSMTLIASHRQSCVSVLLLVKQQVPVRCWLLCLFPPYLRGDGATTCNLSLITPVESFRPRLDKKSYLILLYHLSGIPADNSEWNRTYLFLLFIAFSISRWASRSLIASRFSYSLFPLARPTSTLTRPFLKYILSGIRV